MEIKYKLQQRDPRQTNYQSSDNRQYVQQHDPAHQQRVPSQINYQSSDNRQYVQRSEPPRQQRAYRHSPIEDDEEDLADRRLQSLKKAYSVETAKANDEIFKNEQFREYVTAYEQQHQ